MVIGNRIKEYRNAHNLNQEELADKVLVSRQTVSNWENNKYYPDIKSITLLCDIFNISIEELINEDLEEMNKLVKESELKNFNKLSTIFTIELVVMIISAYPLSKYAGKIGCIIWVILMAITLYTALIIEKYKKKYDIQTYKEIITFCNSKSLSRDDKNQEIGKRPYQKILLSIISGLITILVMTIMKLLLG